MRTALLPILFSSRPTFKQTLSALGLAGNLQFCLDAGDPASYSGAGQSWLDTSGNGQDFFLGADGSAGTSDPSFIAGGRKSYFSGDGGDYFTYDTTNETWMDNLHKDNALGTIIVWINLAAGVTVLWGTNATLTTNIGVNFQHNTANGNTFFTACNGSGTAAFTGAAGLGIAPGVWSMFALSLNEAADTLIRYRNGTTSTTSCTYSSPSSSAATYALQLGAGGNAASPMISGSRFGAAAAWSVALSLAQIEQIFAATRVRYGV